VDLGAIVGSYRDYLPDRRTYREFLRERHPFTPAPVEVPLYHVDQPEADDLVDIRAEVDAFAYLIASRTLRPPLAVGLFGDWGSGKSFFLRSLQHRIDALVNDPAARDRPSRELPFYRHIAQVEFNAWQYVEGDLWASLVEHLFRNLCTSADDSPDLLAKRQRHWIEQLEETDEQREQLQRQHDQLEKQRRVAAAEVDRRQRERELRLEELERQRREHPLAGLKPSATARELARQAGLEAVSEEAEQLHGDLTQLRDTLRRANPALAPLRAGGWRFAVAVAALVMVPVLISAALDRLGAVSNAVASIAAFLASAAAYVRWGARLLSKSLDKIAAARERLEKEGAEQQEKLDTDVAKAREQLEQAEQDLQRSIDEERKLDARVAELEVTLAETTPASVLTEFLTERTGSDDYRRHLGVPALIRRDLERLSKAIEHLNRATEPGDAELQVNRIVLYIDDLDRCPEERVIEVLQAVHLLLAFPLFVVVVAVDARWLVGSLKTRYGDLLRGGATPDDYLEKIFQVPFWVEPLGADVRQRMARGLLAPSLATAPVASPTEPEAEQMDDGIDVVDHRFYELVEELSRTEGSDPSWLEAAHLTVSEDELSLIDEVAPLLGATPRSVKRFVNVYQLVKSMGRHRGWTADDAAPDVILLLAITTGLPDLARELLTAIKRHPDEPLPNAVAKLETTAQHERLTAWLGDLDPRSHCA
ncbi:MAG: P-loop NTPase fold protein, partial [Gaiellaceae bacterium]